VDFATGEIPGFVHLNAGEEASATGICMQLTARDTSPAPTAATATASPGRGPGGQDGGDLGQADRTSRQGRSRHIADLWWACGAPTASWAAAAPSSAARRASKLRGDRGVRVPFRRRRLQPGHHLEATNLATVWKPAAIIVVRAQPATRKPPPAPTRACDNIADRPPPRHARCDRGRLRSLRRARGGGEANRRARTAAARPSSK